jgi:hypothetical protein
MPNTGPMLGKVAQQVGDALWEPPGADRECRLLGSVL